MGPTQFFVAGVFCHTWGWVTAQGSLAVPFLGPCEVRTGLDGSEGAPPPCQPMPLPGPPAPLLQKSVSCPAPNLSSAHQELAHGSWRVGGRGGILDMLASSSAPFPPSPSHLPWVRALITQLGLTFCERSPPGSALCPWDSPGKTTGVGCHSFLQEIFPTQGSKPGLLHYRQILYHRSQRSLPNSSARPPCPGNPAQENRREVMLKNTLSPHLHIP